MPYDYRSGGVHPTVFTDDPLSADSMAARNLHIQQLRTAIHNEIVVRNGTPGSYSDDPLAADDVEGRIVHVNELNREALVLHNTPRCKTDTIPAPTLSDVSVGDDVVKAHIVALRAYVNSKENVSCFCDCDYTCSDRSDNGDNSDDGDNTEI